MTKRKRNGIGLNYKKGSVTDTIFIMLTLIVFTISIIAGYIIIKNFNTTFQSVQAIENEDDSISKDIMLKNTESFPIVFNSLFIFLYLGLTFVACIGAFFVDTHPIFFIFILLSLIVIVFVAMGISNFMETMLTEPVLSEYTNQFGSVQYFFEKLPFFIFFSGVCIGISLMLRPRE